MGMALNIYKSGQGRYTRLYSGFGAAIVVGIGCFRLYVLLQASDVGLWIQTMVPAGLFVVLGFLVFWIVNRPTAADFMIAAEGEMKKVNWSSRQEIVVSTVVVIMVVIMMAALLGITDLIFQMFFGWLLA